MLRPQSKAKEHGRIRTLLLPPPILLLSDAKVPAPFSKGGWLGRRFSRPLHQARETRAGSPRTPMPAMIPQGFFLHGRYRRSLTPRRPWGRATGCSRHRTCAVTAVRRARRGAFAAVARGRQGCFRVLWRLPSKVHAAVAKQSNYDTMPNAIHLLRFVSGGL